MGYRVNSKQGIAFRKWANSVLKKYILEGYAVNNNRITQLGEVIRIMKRTEDSLDAKQVLSVIEKYSTALDLLDEYDHQTMGRPEGNGAILYQMLSCRRCRRIPEVITGQGKLRQRAVLYMSLDMKILSKAVVTSPASVVEIQRLNWGQSMLQRWGLRCFLR